MVQFSFAVFKSGFAVCTLSTVQAEEAKPVQVSWATKQFSVKEFQLI